MKKYLLIITFFFISAPFAISSTIINTEGSYAVTALAPAGDRLVMGHFDGKVRIFDPFSSKLIYELSGHTKPVASLSSDISGKLILSSSQDGSLIFWNGETGEQIKRIFRFGMSFGVCTLSPSGKYAFAAFASSVYVWDTAAWENISLWEKIIGGVYSISVNEEGSLAAVGSKEGKIYIYSIPEGNLIKTLKAGNEIISSLSFAYNSGLLISAGYDRTARVWDIEKGIVIKEFSGHTDTVRAAAAAAGGKFFATASDDGAVLLWNISGKSYQIAPHGSLPASALALDPALRFIAAGRGAIFQDNKYTTLWFPNDSRQSRNIYAFSDAVAVLSSLGYVDGYGSFARYVSIYENGRRYSFAQGAKKYHRPDRLKMPMSKGYTGKKQ